MPAVPASIIDPVWQQLAALLGPTLDALSITDTGMIVHLDRGYDSGVTRQRLAARGLGREIARRGVSAPLTAGERWVVGRPTAWTNAHKELAWCTEPRVIVVVFWIIFSAAIIIVGRLVREGWMRYRWATRPSRQP